MWSRGLEPDQQVLEEVAEACRSHSSMTPDTDPPYRFPIPLPTMPDSAAAALDLFRSFSRLGAAGLRSEPLRQQSDKSRQGGEMAARRNSVSSLDEASSRGRDSRGLSIFNWSSSSSRGNRQPIVANPPGACTVAVRIGAGEFPASSSTRRLSCDNPSEGPYGFSRQGAKMRSGGPGGKEDDSGLCGGSMWRWVPFAESAGMGAVSEVHAASGALKAQVCLHLI